jgi:hypothetical protein
VVCPHQTVSSFSFLKASSILFLVYLLFVLSKMKGMERVLCI